MEKNQNMRMKMVMEKKIMMQRANIFGGMKAQIGTGIIKKIKKLMREETPYIMLFLILH